MKMPKAWLMLASALNLQLGWGAKWKVGSRAKPDRNCLDLVDFGHAAELPFVCTSLTKACGFAKRANG